MDGRAEIGSEERQIPITRGTILTIPAGATPKLKPRGLLRTIALLVDPNYLAEQLRWLPLHHPLVHQLQLNIQDGSTVGRLDLPSKVMDALSPVLLRIVRQSMTERRQFALLASASDVFDIISRAKSSATITASENRRLPRKEITNATRLLRSHLGRAWTVDDLAREVLISPSQLTRIFRADLGVSPAAYLRQVRVDRMAELLSTMTIGVSAAARQAGWSNTTVASRAFKERYGVSPRSFAATHLEARHLKVA
ncbi:helix-turn-helix transcriptional regulator [Leucobacter sp. M11]|nr:helix-turn-helix transcriptional regulator [Leucobacter sp. M11]